MGRRFSLLGIAVVLLVCGYAFIGADFRVAKPWESQQRSENADALSPDLGAYQLASQSCWFRVSWQRSVSCSRLQTPGGFSLPVVVIEGRADTAPVLYLSGGPGDSAHFHDSIDYWLDWYDQAGLDGDLVLVDRRGTGISRPRQDCDTYTRFSRRILAENVSLEEELRQGQQVLRECAQQLADAGFSSRDYGTRHSARDLGALMQALGYQRWHLYGVSYGTRLGLEMMERYRSQTLSAVLDSVYPKGKGALTEWPQLLSDSFRQFFHYCDAGSCPGGARLEAQFWQALSLLQQTPLSLSVKSWDGEAPYRVVVNDHRFLAAVFDALYDRTTADRIPAAIAAVLARRSQGLVPLIEPFVNYAFDPAFNAMVFMAIECAETAAVDESAYMVQVSRYPRFTPYTQDLWRYDSCEAFNRLLIPGGAVVSQNEGRDGGANGDGEGVVDGEEVGVAVSYQSRVFQRQGITGIADIPVLILAGRLDPITPSAWAEELHAQWPASQLQVYADAGHAVVGQKHCVHSALGDFYRAPHRKMPAPDC